MFSGAGSLVIKKELQIFKNYLKGDQPYKVGRFRVGALGHGFLSVLLDVFLVLKF